MDTVTLLLHHLFSQGYIVQHKMKRDRGRCRYLHSRDLQTHASQHFEAEANNANLLYKFWSQICFSAHCMCVFALTQPFSFPVKNQQLPIPHLPPTGNWLLSSITGTSQPRACPGISLPASLMVFLGSPL